MTGQPISQADGYAEPVLSRQRRAQLRHPEREAARQAARYAVSTGRLVKPEACSACGARGETQGHHDDYSKPLMVRWLCSACHGREHAGPAEAGALRRGRPVIGHKGHPPVDPGKACQPCRVYRARRALGLSQAELGEVVLRDARTVRRWESGDQVPSALALKVLDQMVAALPDSKPGKRPKGRPA